MTRLMDWFLSQRSTRGLVQAPRVGGLGQSAALSGVRGRRAERLGVPRAAR